MLSVKLDNVHSGHTIWNQCKQIPISMECAYALCYILSTNVNGWRGETDKWQITCLPRQCCTCVYLGRRANKTASRCEIRYMMGKPKQRISEKLRKNFDGDDWWSRNECTGGGARRRRVESVCVWEVDKEDACIVLTLAWQRVFGWGGRRGRATEGNNKCCFAVNLDKSLHDGSHYIFLQWQGYMKGKFALDSRQQFAP